MPLLAHHLSVFHLWSVSQVKKLTTKIYLIARAFCTMANSFSQRGLASKILGPCPAVSGVIVCSKGINPVEEPLIP